MAKEAVKRLGADDYILELGAGTGPFTTALLHQGIQPDRILVIEIDPRLVAYLRAQYPDVTIIQETPAIWLS